MKNKKIVLIILIILFFISISLAAICVKKVYNNVIIPVNKKIAIYENLKKQEESLDKKIKIKQEEIDKLDRQSKKINQEKEELEKKVFEYQVKSGTRVVYLTFDDGPSEYTQDILNILDKYNVKATFFVTCSDNLEEFSKKIIEKGHTLALHTCTHKYSYVYSSVESYYEDLNNISNLVEKYTGVKSKYIRFPGGSSNTVSKAYSRGIMSILTNKVKEDGYKYYDWNIDSNDAGGANSEQVYANVIGALQNSDRGVNMVLMHDTKSATKDALDKIINDALNMGYAFSNINDYTKEIHHGVNN